MLLLLRVVDIFPGAVIFDSAVMRLWFDISLFDGWMSAGLFEDRRSVGVNNNKAINVGNIVDIFNTFSGLFC